MRSTNFGRMAAGFAALLTLCGLVQVRGSNMPPAGDVQTAWVLPEHPSKEFPAGDLIPVLVTIRNDGSSDYNMSYIMGSLNLPKDFHYYVQNFTYSPLWTNIPSKEEATFQYKFRPDKSLSPMELRVALTVFYQNEQGSSYSTTFFNETIDIVEKPTVIDYEAIMMVAVMVAILAGAAYGAAAWFGTLNVVKKASTRKTKPGKSAGEGLSEDWLQGTPHAQHKVGKKSKAQGSEGKKTS